jgi:hypothetical protein
MPGLSTPLLVSIYCWFAWEGGLLVRDLVRRKGRLGPDRGTRVIVSLTLAGSIWIGILLRSWVPALDTPAPNAFAAAGVVVIWVGLILAGLGGTDARPILQHLHPGRRRPGRRHPRPVPVGAPSLLHRPAADRPGFGLGVGNWLSLAICAVIPLVGLLPRIAVEEAELARVLGDRYRSYQKAPRRLVPGLW